MLIDIHKALLLPTSMNHIKCAWHVSSVVSRTKSLKIVGKL